MIELDPEQQKAIDQGMPVRVVDPATRKALIVMPDSRALATDLLRIAARISLDSLSDDAPDAAPLRADPEHPTELAAAHPKQSTTPPPSQIAPQMLKSQQAFRRDLPSLVSARRNRGKWAAYRGDERVVIASYTDAYQECFRRGLARGDFYVGKIEPAPEVPPWEPVESDRSLFEATDAPRATRHESPRPIADLNDAVFGTVS